MSEHLIYGLIPKVMADIGAVSKDRRNEQQKYAFRGIEDFYLAAHPAFVTHGIFCVPEVLEHASTAFDKTNEFGKTTTWRHVTIKVKHQFFASDGSHVDVVTMGEGLDNSDKATNKAMSGAMKYALIELFTVPTQDVEDSDRTSPETGRPRTGPAPAVTAQPISVAPPKKAAAVPAATNIKGAVEPQKAADRDGGQIAGREAQVASREAGNNQDDKSRSPAPTEAMANALMRKLADKTPPPEAAPFDPDACIDLPEQRAIHRQAKEATTLSSKDAGTYFSAYLKKRGYVDEQGNGSTKRIPKMLFAEFKAEVVTYMSGLK